MAILCLSSDLKDLERRLGNIHAGYTRDKKAVTAAQLNASGAMTVLLKDALQPNMVQTLENNPVLIHGGPFANIAHGCNSVLATTTALKVADYVVTEAGFGADLGAEKFFDIKCRKAGLSPSAVVIVATVRALKMHGGVEKADLGTPNPEAVRKGGVNLARHLENLSKFGVPAVVAINNFYTDTPEEVAVVKEIAAAAGSEAVLCTHWANGSAGTEELARKVVALVEGGTANFAPIYGDDMPLLGKIETIAKTIYRASAIAPDSSVVSKLKGWEADGYGHLPVCMAKTQYSFATDPTKRGAPVDHVVPIRDVILCAGAEFVVAVCGDIMRMPGLPKVPSADFIKLDENGLIQGLF